ncbi:cytochrome b561/polyisoprenoid-binding protein YceI [Altererythrobacter atlanticus]|uniref:Uncharacterized protein n=1 Tax=Croceibacterium atlanticum TaxID=1267766 RepID=A0A0F7KXZ6_9SPHN|nr:cytochrome b/b6 domain-containing protein [Croceibacterium atlanticum]AKH43685.1 hypothetical protein WYH_02655 [Croceibacterium atlanticum]MBB5733831.1 cytochrome b561/polyisoprenoid-binding protein YceI [Croceibacterium atlanticum]
MKRYSSGAIILHWLIAFALAFEIALGFSMPRGTEGFALFQLHKSVGITILALTVLRILWRFTHQRPPAVEKGVTHLLANAVHIGFYAFMLLAPLTGWAIVSTSDIVVPTMLYGTVPLPHLPLPAGINEAVEETHELLAWVAIALFVLHVAGAIRHELLLRRALLVRMAPNRLTGALLGLGVVAVFFVTGSYIAGSYARPDAEEPADIAQEAEVDTPAAPLAAPGPEPGEGTATEEEDEAAGEEPPTAEAADPAAEAAPTPAAVQPGPPPKWSIRPGGRLGFSVGNGGETISGSFSQWSGSIAFDPENPASADIRIEINLASASVGDATQDGMLQGGEYFATDNFATATFRATSARKTGGNNYTANGTLTLKGVSRPQVITFRLTGTAANRHVEGNASIARAPFDIGTGSTGGDLDANVAVSFSFDATRQ